MINPKLDRIKIDSLLKIKSIIKEDDSILRGNIVYDVPSSLKEKEDDNLIIKKFRGYTKIFHVEGLIYNEPFSLRNNTILFKNRNNINDGVSCYIINAGLVTFLDHKSKWCPFVDDINYEYDLTLPKDYFSWTDEDVLMFRMCI